MRGGWGQQEPGHRGTGFTPFLNGPMPSYWQCRLGWCPTLCFPESVAASPHWSALLTALMRILDTRRVCTTHPLSSAVSLAW